MRFLQIGIILMLFTLFTGCVGHVSSHYESSNIRTEFQDEHKRLNQLYDDLKEELQKNGLISSNSDLVQYVQKVGEKLVPEELHETMPINFFVVRDPIPNAFAIDSGDIFINIGLLAFLENEAQLAAIIGHEISHAIHRHGLEAYIRHKRTVITANLSDVFLLGTGLSYLGAYANLAVHSRENEKEADVSSIELVRKGGYDIREIIKAFEVFSKLPQQKEFMGSIYSSHPENQERIMYLNSIISEQTNVIHNAAKNKEKYKKIRYQVTDDALNMLLYQHQYLFAECLLNAAKTYFTSGDHWDCYEAEIYRLKALNPRQVAQECALYKGKNTFKEEYNLANNEVEQNLKRAQELFKDVLTPNPSIQNSSTKNSSIGLAHRGLGLIEWEKGNKSVAKEHLRQYLSIHKEPRDRIYINRLLNQ